MSRELFGIAMLGVQMAINIPVILRLLRARSGEGMSLSGEAVWVAGGVGWIIYGVMTDSWTLVVSGSLAVIGCAVTSALVVKYSRPPMKIAASLCGVTLVAIIGGALVAGVPGLSWSMAVFGVVQFLPQLWETLKSLLRRESAGGVSVLGTTFRAVYTGGWAVYAGAWWLWGIPASQVDWPLMIWGAAGVVVFGLQAVHANLANRVWAIDGDEKVPSMLSAID